ncbi:MAG TPA: hypothetical protein VFL13_13985 [Candidatus Baltobacteraceae bacterium]|nr:hypothetical protein [Candidatus Baltobacteraceae bacterium]
MTKRFPLRPVLLAVGALLLIWVIVEIVLAGNEPAPPPAGGQPITTKNGKVTGNRISTRSWTFDYQSAQMSADGINASINGVRNGVIYKNGKPYLKLAAKQVSVNTQTFDFTAIGTVHIETISAADGTSRTFETDLVQWTNATKMLVLSHPSVIRTGDQTMRVSNITVDFNKDEVHMGRIEGSLQAPQP